MALRRMVPVDYFKDPDVLSLSKREHRQILLSLILSADDEGRGLAQAALIAREMGDYSSKEIEEGLTDLAANDLIVLYQAGRHRYYWLTKWNQWQTIRADRLIPSNYPAPPVSSQLVVVTCPSTGNQVTTTGCQLTAEENLSQENLRSGDEERETHPDASPANVVLFPATRTDTTTHQERETTKQIAAILSLPVSHALARLVAAYARDPTMCLPIEADAAREWIDDRQRNQAGKTMTVNFFRNWLKRERKEIQSRQTQQTQATGTDGTTSPPSHSAPREPRRKSLMGLEDEYRAVYEQKEKP